MPISVSMRYPLKVFICVAALAGSAHAQEAVDFAARGLTPLGSQRAGNQDGTIPAWTGGITTPPANYKNGRAHPDPYGNEQPLFTITRANLAQYAKSLSAGQRELFKRYDTYRMPVYPSHRACALPQMVYDATARNGSRARLTDNGNGIAGALMGVPFPIPKSGVEILWNHNFHYYGHGFTSTVTGANVYPNGNLTKIVRVNRIYNYYTDPKTRSPEDLNNAQYIWMAFWRSPARIAGSGFSVTNTINQIQQPRPGFFYRPDVRKVTRAPPAAFSYEAPLSSSDGMRVADTLYLYGGTPDRYDWELKGKQEIYIPYNVYKATEKKVRFETVVTPRHLNPDFLRYEKHRVWVVEGRLKADFEHPYHRRVFYVDEDSWIIVLADLYDAKGTLVRSQEGFTKNYYEMPACVLDFDVLYDFKTERYNLDNYKMEYKPANLRAKLSPRDFGAAPLRRAISR